MLNLPPGTSAYAVIKARPPRRQKQPRQILWPAEAKTALWMERAKPLRRLSQVPLAVAEATAKQASPAWGTLTQGVRAALAKIGTWLRLI